MDWSLCFLFFSSSSSSNRIVSSVFSRVKTHRRTCLVPTLLITILSVVRTTAMPSGSWDDDSIRFWQVNRNDPCGVRCLRVTSAHSEAESNDDRGVTMSSSSPPPSPSPPPPSVATYEAITDALSKSWSFAPFPRCTRRQLLQTQTYLAACSEDGSSLLGIVGIVWVPLNGRQHLPPISENAKETSSSLATRGTAPPSLPCVECYIQLVLVAPSQRRRGIARRLLHAALGHSMTTNSPSWYGSSGSEPYQPCYIARWRLHTMDPTTDGTRRYLAQLEKTEGAAEDESRLPKADHSEDRDATVTTRNVEESEVVERSIKNIAAVIDMYERLGFTRRRELYRYYAGTADAIEMVREAVSNPQRGAKRPRPT